MAKKCVAVVAAFFLAFLSSGSGATSILAHYNVCSIGNKNHVLIVFVDSNQGGKPGSMDIHVDQVPNNDAYDSVDLKRIRQNACLP